MQSFDLQSTEEKIFKTACHLCAWGCGVDVHVKGGKITKAEGMAEHPSNRGRLCPKGTSIVDFVYSPNRITHPMKKEGDGWKQISWDEALDTIAAKLMHVKETYGGRSFALCWGMVILTLGRASQELVRRFCDVYGTPNVFSVDSMCYRCRIVGSTLTTGRWLMADPENSRCIVLWGQNPEASCPPISWVIDNSVAKGAKLIVIDPRSTDTAKRADIHVQLRPGTDCALALGMLNVIISEKLYDKEFVEQWTFGFDKLAEHVKQYTPEEVEKITWVPAATIKEAARVIATTKPMSICQGAALDMHITGVQAARAIAILESVTGNIDIPGGYVTVPRMPSSEMRLLERVEEEPLGTDRYPFNYRVFGRIFGEGQTMVLPDVLLTGEPYPIKAMFITGSNPVRTWPNQKKVVEALKKLDFLVVMDLTMTDTAQLADIVLPAASFLERTDLCDLYVPLNLPYVMLRKKIIEVGECWEDLKVWLELAKRMGLEEYFPWKNSEEVIEYYLEPSEITVDLLTNIHPEGVFYGEIKYNGYKKKGFRTPSGKVELYSETLEKLGYEPMPTHLEPPESPVSAPELAKEYPLILNSGVRVKEILHSQLYDIQRLRKRVPGLTADIHPKTAKEYGISQGDTVVVETKRGSVEIQVRLTKDILPGVVHMPHRYGEANVNILTDEACADPMTGNPAVKAMLCKITKKT